MKSCNGRECRLLNARGKVTVSEQQADQKWEIASTDPIEETHDQDPDRRIETGKARTMEMPDQDMAAIIDQTTIDGMTQALKKKVPRIIRWAASLHGTYKTGRNSYWDNQIPNNTPLKA